MTEKLYNQIANAFVGMAILSAFLYQGSGQWRSLALGIGVVAGVGATLLYFCYGSLSQTSKNI